MEVFTSALDHQDLLVHDSGFKLLCAWFGYRALPKDFHPAYHFSPHGWSRIAPIAERTPDRFHLGQFWQIDYSWNISPTLRPW